MFKFSAGSSLSNKNSKSINVKYAEQSYPIILESERNESIQSYISHDEFRQELSSAKLELLQSELESCRQLNELEPGNKCKNLYYTIWFAVETFLKSFKIQGQY